MKDIRHKFLNLLFDEGDKVAFGNDKQLSNKPVDPFPAWLHTDAEMFCINPLKKWRQSENVTSINSLLFEIDEDIDKNRVPVKEQIRLFVKSGLPFTTMTFSGSKSVHVIVRFAEPLESGQWQRQWWHTIQKCLNQRFKELYTENVVIIDKSTKALVQLSRVPESTRSNGNVQKLIMMRDRVTQAEMQEWLAEYGFSVEQPKEYETEAWTWGTNNDKGALEKFETCKRWCQKDHGLYSPSWTTGGHMWFFELGKNMWRVELDPDAGANLARLEYGQTYLGNNGGGNVIETIKSGWEWSKRANIKHYQL